MEEMIIVNGQAVSLKEYKKSMRAKNPQKKSSKKKQTSEIKILPKDIHAMMNKVRLIKSLNAYYDNGYRQWGNICKRILNLKEIRVPFVAFRVKARDLDRITADINELSKKNSKAVYDFVRRLSYLLEDISDCIKELGEAVSKCDLINLHSEHECINGHGRRLGLKVLISRTYSSTQELKKIVSDLQYYADQKEWKAQ